mmetsp:Transcript_6917/g.12256  ORF Transcript_6917/g.12256 Transcript_6917/m.12256 type:complete len:370 (+) Transcript_6917:568-1677(+)
MRCMVLSNRSSRGPKWLELLAAQGARPSPVCNVWPVPQFDAVDGVATCTRTRTDDSASRPRYGGILASSTSADRSTEGVLSAAPSARFPASCANTDACACALSMASRFATSQDASRSKVPRGWQAILATPCPEPLDVSDASGGQGKLATLQHALARMPPREPRTSMCSNWLRQSTMKLCCLCAACGQIHKDSPASAAMPPDACSEVHLSAPNEMRTEGAVGPAMRSCIDPCAKPSACTNVSCKKPMGAGQRIRASESGVGASKGTHSRRGSTHTRAKPLSTARWTCPDRPGNRATCPKPVNDSRTAGGLGKNASREPRNGGRGKKGRKMTATSPSRDARFTPTSAGKPPIATSTCASQLTDTSMRRPPP